MSERLLATVADVAFVKRKAAEKVATESVEPPPADVAPPKRTRVKDITVRDAAGNIRQHVEIRERVEEESVGGEPPAEGPPGGGP